MIDPQTQGKVALVTGANHGIGAATAKKLAAQGAKVFIAYYILDSPYSDAELREARLAGVGGDLLYDAMQKQSWEDVAESIRAAGGDAVALELDLRYSENVVKLFDRCEADLGPAELLIINHTHDELETFDPGLATDEEPAISMISSESIDLHFAINVRASALMMREYLQRHIERGASWGWIVSLTTSAGHAWNVTYAASKHAMVSYCYSAAEEMGKYGITVNVVRPGPTQTGYITTDNERNAVAGTPLGRIGEPEDVADVIVFLASEQGRWVTGQIVAASGGQ